MLFYNVYYQTGDTSNTIEFEATCGESFYGLNHGTKEWMEHALRALNINSDIENFTKSEVLMKIIKRYFYCGTSKKDFITQKVQKVEVFEQARIYQRRGER